MTITIMREEVVQCCLTIFYASPIVIHREELWSHLQQLRLCLSSTWVLLGNFNQPVCPVDKKDGARFKYQQEKKLSDVLDSCGIIDLGYTWPKFTWTNSRKGRAKIREHIDHVWFNLLWHEKFPTVVVHQLPRMHSDHHPILMHYEPPISKPSNGMFLSLTAWLVHAQFGDFLHDAWKLHDADLGRTIKEFTIQAQQWNRLVFGHIGLQKKGVLARLGGIKKTVIWSWVCISGTISGGTYSGM